MPDTKNDFTRNIDPDRDISQAADQEVDELDFEDEIEPTFVTQHTQKDLEKQALAETDEEANDDPAQPMAEDYDENELTPETLIQEDGAASPREPGAGIPADEDLSVVGVDEIGAGQGLDEEELARVKPLNAKSSAKK